LARLNVDTWWLYRSWFGLYYCLSRLDWLYLTDRLWTSNIDCRGIEGVLDVCGVELFDHLHAGDAVLIAPVSNQIPC
jgi:hypothetical protein